jgi:predicted NAD/FAD-binding protein
VTTQRVSIDKNRRVAVIGGGISGAAAAWLLRDAADVRLYEAEGRFGGHTHTYEVEDSGTRVCVDTGFMVFNRPNYPLLGALFDHLGVATYPTEMSFSASIDDGALEYAGTSLNTLFGQRVNLANPRFWAMLRDIMRFNRVASRTVARGPASRESLAAFLDRHRLSEDFRCRYLYPMAAAIWSCPTGRIEHFPARSFLQFFANHGLIRLRDRPRWLTVDGGASTYMRRLVADLGRRAICGTPVGRVERVADGVRVTLQDGRSERFDDVVLACHTDEALRILAAPTPSERRLLSAIRYQPNRVLLHRDARLMPRRRRVWASWNYIGRSRGDRGRAVSVSYWMNSLQRLATSTNYFVSLNPLTEPRAELVRAEFEYMHPVFDGAALEAQSLLPRLQGRDRVWFAGAWTGYGFHEDGMRSGVEVAAALGATVPWQAEVDDSRGLSALPAPTEQAA